MLGSTLLDVAIGLVFVYLLVSLVCSAANELIERLLKNRATDMERGIREMLAPGNESQGDTLMQRLYDHPLINGLFKGKYVPGGKDLPSYIPARSFALALMDLVQPASTASATTGSPPGSPLTSPPSSPIAPGAAGATPATPAPNVTFTVAAAPTVSRSPLDPANPLCTLRNAVGSGGADGILTEQAQKSLLTLIDAAGADASKARENIENWFNSSMDRVSGWYKRRSQKYIMFLGFVIAVAFNIDSIVIAERLSTDKSLRDSLVAAAQEYAKANANASPTPTPQSGGTTSSAVRGEAEATTTAGSAAAAQKPPKPKASPSLTATGPAPSPSPSAGRSPSPGPSPSPGSSPSPESSPSPRPPPSQGASPLPGPSAAPSPSGSPSGSPAAPERKGASATGDLASACKDPNSPECKFEKSKRDLQALGLPIGWDNKVDQAIVPRGRVKDHPREWLLKLLGWLITALAVSLGAPFWFDVLNKFIVVRSTIKPHEKSPEEPSKQ